ncbi:MAG TPA: ATP-binding protein [Phycisphaerae bacterium]|nr:ATP-binding protein [Phycisphaerae bacterium]
MADPDKAPPRSHPADLPDEYYRLVCQHAGAALIATDTDLKIRFWNSSAHRVFGASAAQMLGTSVLSIMPGDHRRAAEALLQRAVRHREASQFEFSLRDSAGEPRDLAVVMSPIIDDHGVTLGASTWVRDITRRVELARQVGLERKMAALGEMAGALAHHFNNILGGVVTSVDFALAANDPAVEHRVMSQTARSLARASRLVDNLLAFAEGAHRESDLGDLTEVVLQAIDVVEPELAQANVSLQLDLRAVPVTAVPRGPMITVVFNLVHNAVEAMRGGGELRIEMFELEGGSLLRFIDTGCGMNEDVLDRAFEPFYSTKPAPQGQEERAPGFGLAVVHAIVQEVGGRVSVASQPGKGTTFEIWIPSGLDALAPEQLPEPD